MVPFLFKHLEDVVCRSFDRSVVEIRQDGDDCEPRERWSPSFGAGIDSVLEQPRGLLDNGMDRKRW